MDIFLDDITSLMLLRAMSRDGNGLALAQSAFTRPTALPVRTAKLNRLGVSELLGYLHIPEQHPLGILTPSDANRVRAHGFRCKIRSAPRGEHPFLLLTTTDRVHPNPLLPRSTHVHVLHPVNIVLDAATNLRTLVRQNLLKHAQAVLRLFELCLELCGSYSRDPFRPMEGDITYGTQPWLDAETLRTALRPTGNERGLSLARKVAELTYNGSGSPQETFLGPALFFPTELGGLHLCDFEANVPLKLTAQEHMSIRCRQITPDFTLPNYRTVVEYLGKVHFEGDNPQRDHQRSLDYQTLGYREFDFWFDDVCTRPRFMQSAARIVATIATYEGPKAQQRFTRLANDPGFIARQRELFEVFCPWVQ